MNADSSGSYASGHVHKGLPFPLRRHDPVFIGSDRGRCDIVIDGADPVHAELRWDPEESHWWVCDDPAPGETILNEMPIVKEPFRESDTLDIAGVRLRYANGELTEADPEEPEGLRVTLRDVSVAAGKRRILTGVSFQVRPGSFCAILGTSGSGKSTLIQRIAGFASFKGDIRLNGHDLRTDQAELLPLVAYLPQDVEATLHGEMTVARALGDFARVHLAPEATPDCADKLAEVGLGWEKYAGKRVGSLSGGEKKRLALALALLRKPQLLLLDEPTAGLDPATEADIMELLKGIAGRHRTILCATHVLGSLDKCDTALLLSADGRPVFFGPTAEAPAKIGADDWAGVYRKLKETPGWPPPGDIPSDPAPRKLPAAPRAASFGRTFGATLFRLVRAIVGVPKNLALFFANPIGISAVLLAACNSELVEYGKHGTVWFCMAVAMFWLGVSGAVRNLVAERIPKRSLERMRGVPPAPYFAAHVAFAALSSAVQALAFLALPFLLKLGHAPFAASAFGPFWLVLGLVGFAGGCVGLSVSAFSKTELQAVWLLPFVAILALFFSKPVLEREDGKPTGVLLAVEQAMPTLRPQLLLETSMDLARIREAHYKVSPETRQDIARHNAAHWGWFLLFALGYPVVFLLLAAPLQAWRERQWEGR